MRNIKGIVFMGMGGSGVVGEIVRDIIVSQYSTVPIYIVKDYSPPFRLDKHHLVIAVSYSGTTAETIVAASQAKLQGAKVVFITSGGDILDSFEKSGVPVVRVSAGLQPRYSVPEMVGAVYGLLSSLEVDGVEEGRLRKGAEELRDFLARFSGVMLGYPREAAEQLLEKTVVVYSHSHLTSTGYRFKAQLNENAKHPAFSSTLPEAGHNEVEAWLTAKGIANVILRSRWEAPAISEVIRWMAGESEKHGLPVLEIRADAQNPLAEVMKLILLVDLISISLAGLKGVNPLSLEILPKVRESVKHIHERLKKSSLEVLGKSRR